MKQVPRVNTLPETGFVRLAQILGDPRRGIPGPIPVGTTTWWGWVKAGRAPKALKLGPGMTVWRAEEIHALIARLAAEAEAAASLSRGVSLTVARRRKRAVPTPQGTPPL
jgi:prophage regulatory protein